MRKSLKFALPMALAAVAITGCSQDASNAPDSPSVVDGAIRFAPNTSNTRTGDITASNLNSFNVYAYTIEGDKHTLFMDNVTVTRNENNVWTYSPLQFWPAQKVDFYAFAPSGNWAGDHGPFGTSSSYLNYPGDTDLVYAVSLDNSGSAQTENAQVILNFRHALSKVAVNLSSSNEELEVKVGNVVLANIYSTGTFAYPTESTTPSASPSAESVCTWNDLKTASVYIFHMSQRPDERITLSTTPTDMSAESPDSGGPKYIIPQDLPYDEGDNTRDAYLAITCTIYDKATGVQLWPNDNTPAENKIPGSTFNEGLIKVPLHTNQFSAWQAGNFYIYNVVVNANPDMGHINFGTPTVDNYVTVETSFE